MFRPDGAHPKWRTMTAAVVPGAGEPARVLLIGMAQESPDGDFARILGEAGFDCRVVPSLEKAIASIHVRSPDAVLIGTSVRDRSQRAATRDLRRALSDAGVAISCVVARNAGEEPAEEALLFGADELLLAPVSPVELVARTRTIVRLTRLRQQLARDGERHATEIEELTRQLHFDPLTGVSNRSHLRRRLTEEVERATRYGQPLTVIAVDIDHFKHVNDTHGHAIGDGVLRSVAGVLSRGIREVDLLARVGGEEFVILAPSTTLAGGRILAERLRSSLQNAPVIATSGSGMHVRLKITASFGVACMDPQSSGKDATADILLESADAALYLAKSGGRNQVMLGELMKAVGSGA